MFCTPHPNDALELLGPNIETFRVCKDVILPTLDWQDIERPQHFSKCNEQTIRGEIRPRTDPPSPSETAMAGLSWVYFLTLVWLFLNPELKSLGSGEESYGVEVVRVRIVGFVGVYGPVVTKDVEPSWDRPALVTVSFC